MAEISATQWQELSSLLDELFDSQDEARAATGTDSPQQ